MSLPERGARNGAQRLPAGVWALGVGSLFMDASSEMIHSLLPLLLVSSLGASALAVGLIEGAAEAATAFLKVFSGSLSDRLGRRKPLLLCGYGLAALVRPLFPLASTIGWVFAARFLDRVGKGIRGAPRDALIADLTAPGQRGAAYGLRQALDAAGALAGPLLAVAGMLWLSGDLRAVLWLALLPACLSVAVLALFVREPQRRAGAGPLHPPPRLREMVLLPRRFWGVAALGTLLTLARFSEAFLLLRAVDLGLAESAAPLVLAAMSLAFTLTAYPAGRAADRLDARRLLLPGLALLAGADLVLAAATGPAGVFAGAALWGLHMALTQGLLAKLVADAVPAALRGTGFGLFNLMAGLALLAGSGLAGALWSLLGPAATFLAGAGFAGAACGALLLLPEWGTRASGTKG